MAKILHQLSLQNFNCCSAIVIKMVVMYAHGDKRYIFDYMLYTEFGKKYEARTSSGTMSVRSVPLLCSSVLVIVREISSMTSIVEYNGVDS